MKKLIAGLGIFVLLTVGVFAGSNDIGGSNNVIVSLWKELTSTSVELLAKYTDIAVENYCDENGANCFVATDVGGAGATTALDNLASTAVNTDIISDTDGTDSLGSTGIRWLKGWFDDMETTNEPTVGGVLLSALTQTFTNKTLDCNGTGNGCSNIDVADLSNGTAGELQTWATGGAPDTVAVGTLGQVLTSNGVGEAPTMEDAGSSAPKILPFPVNNKATYTDDPDNYFAVNNGNNAFRLCRYPDLTHGVYYRGGTQQTITPASLLTSANGTRGQIIFGGFMYAFPTVTATPLSELWRVPVTSDINNAGNWTKMTGVTFSTASFYLIGADGTNIWFTDNTANFKKYSISGTTISLAATVNVTGSDYGNSSVVNDNGVYATFASAPKMRKAAHDGTLDGTQFQDKQGAMSTSIGFYLNTGTDLDTSYLVD